MIKVITTWWVWCLTAVEQIRMWHCRWCECILKSNFLLSSWVYGPKTNMCTLYCMLLGIGLLLTWVLIGFKIINFRNLLYCISLDFIIHTNVILKVHLILSMYLNSRSLWLHWVHMFIPHSDVYIGVTHKHTFNLGRTHGSKLIP